MLSSFTAAKEFDSKQIHSTQMPNHIDTELMLTRLTDSPKALQARLTRTTEKSALLTRSFYYANALRGSLSSFRIAMNECDKRTDANRLTIQMKLLARS